MSETRLKSEPLTDEKLGLKSVAASLQLLVPRGGQLEGIERAIESMDDKQARQLIDNLAFTMRTAKSFVLAQ